MTTLQSQLVQRASESAQKMRKRKKEKDKKESSSKGLLKILTKAMKGKKEDSKKRKRKKKRLKEEGGSPGGGSDDSGTGSSGSSYTASSSESSGEAEKDLDPPLRKRSTNQARVGFTDVGQPCQGSARHHQQSFSKRRRQPDNGGENRELFQHCDSTPADWQYESTEGDAPLEQRDRFAPTGAAGSVGRSFGFPFYQHSSVADRRELELSPIFGNHAHGGDVCSRQFSGTVSAEACQAECQGDQPRSVEHLAWTPQKEKGRTSGARGTRATRAPPRAKEKARKEEKARANRVHGGRAHGREMQIPSKAKKKEKPQDK